MGEFYLKYEYWLAFTQLFLAMLGMGATLRVKDFVAVSKAPKAMLSGLGIQILLVPLAAFLILISLDINPGVAIGLAIISAIPGGTTSNIYTFFAKGHIALSIAITAITTVACLITVPLVLRLLISEYVPPDFSLPVGKIARETLTAILIPLALGMVIYVQLPRYNMQIAKWSIRISLTIIVVIVLGAASSGRLDWNAFGSTNAMILVGFTLLLMCMGLLAPRLLGLSRQDIVAIDMEVSVRNVNLAVLIIASLFPASNTDVAGLGSMALFTALAYGALMMLPAVILIVGNRMLDKRPLTSESSP
ncbi:MAG: hypothetical protein CMN84_06980 [Spongiibacteraceae bacterium]|jgi:bile acid:Na+ symporter, BASS family|nr:hypothetical protein [Spongiibacteraceae bacterium]